MMGQLAHQEFWDCRQTKIRVLAGILTSVVVARLPIPEIVRRLLIGKSGNLCMNPSCQEELITKCDGELVFIGDCAHIKARADGGSDDIDNLILLCKNCHKKYEPRGKPEKTKKLRKWKDDSERRYLMRTQKEFETKSQLVQRLTPLLNENRQIFYDYGPNSDIPDTHNMWKVCEARLLSNNAEIAGLLNTNRSLLPATKQQAIDEFVAHANEFAMTRTADTVKRVKLFPKEILSLVKLDQFFDRNSSICLNSLQNLLNKLHKENRLVSFSPFPHLRLTYLKNNGTETVLDARNPRTAKPVYVREKVLSPISTNLRIDNLDKITSWLSNIPIKWSFNEDLDLTVITLNKDIKVKLFYSYAMSRIDVLSTNFGSIELGANIYNWNDGPITDDAMELAKKCGIELMEWKDFFAFCHKIAKS